MSTGLGSYIMNVSIKTILFGGEGGLIKRYYEFLKQIFFDEVILKKYSQLISSKLTYTQSDETKKLRNQRQDQYTLSEL